MSGNKGELVVSAVARDALRPHRRRAGRIKRFPAVVFVRVTEETSRALHDAASALGLGLSEYVRLVLADSLGVPDERPNVETTKEA